MMSGNCAIGDPSMATTPTITMRMAITIATMGRLIKNFDMLGALRINCHSISDFGNSFGHDAVARAHTAFDDPHFAHALANLHRADRDAVIRADNGYLIASLQFVHRTL